MFTPPVKQRAYAVPCDQVEDALTADRAAVDRYRNTCFGYLALGNLAMSYYSRFKCTHDTADVDRAIALMREVCDLVPPRAADAPITRTNLALVLAGSGRLTDIREGITIGRQALTMVPAGSERYATMLDQVAGFSLQAYRQGRDPADLDTAIDLAGRALELLTPAAPGYDIQQANLAGALVDRFLTNSSYLDDLNRAITIYEALDRPDAGADYPDFRAGIRTHLSHALQLRYQRDGAAADLDRAQETQRRASEANPQHHDVGILALETRASTALDTFRQTGRLDDLERAISALQAVVDAAANDPRRPIFLTNLASTYVARFRTAPSTDSPDLHTAITMYREALDAPPPPGHRAGVLALLGNALLELVQPGLPRAREHLDEAFALITEAVGLAPGDENVYHGVQMALAHVNAAQLMFDDDLSRLGPSITLYEQIRDSLPENSQLALNAKASLALLRMVKAERVGRRSDRLAAFAAFAELEADPNAGPNMIFELTTQWAEAAWQRGALDDAGEIYELTIRALHRLVGVQLNRDDQQSWLRRAATIAGQAAYALAESGKLDAAVVAFETGRAMMLSDALDRQHADLDGLTAAGHRELAGEFRRASAALGDLEREQVSRHPAPGASGATPDPGGVRAGYDRLVARIRRLTGFEQFLRPPDIRALRSAVEALGEPVVLVFATGRGGLALIVPPSPAAPVAPVRLPRLTKVTTQRMVASYLEGVANTELTRAQTARRQVDEGTEWMWERIMQPVTAALGSARRVTLVPAGQLGAIPLHAAGVRDEGSAFGRRYVHDRLTVSYAPNIRTLDAARRALPRDDSAVLTIVDPALPSAPAEGEIVGRHFGAGAQVLRGAEATRAAVLGRLPGAPVLHFACHGEADQDQPLRSALRLANNERLTLRDLLGVRFDRARLAVLSACETAIAGKALPDEVVSLPTGLFQAGIVGVVASLWEVDDDASALLMARFYQHWRGEGREPREALRRAQRWLCTSTGAEQRAAFPGTSFTRKPPGYRLADWLVSRRFAEPEFWAAFVYLGR